MSPTFPPFGSHFGGLAPSKKPSPALLSLARVLDSLTRRGLYYSRKQIELDGLTFEECSFENCTFITKTGNFTLRNCRLLGSESVIYYQGDALKVAKLYEFMSSTASGRVQFPAFYPKLDSDGRISIE